MIIVHVITCLNDGGAEAILYRLCLAGQQNLHVVITLRKDGKYGALLKKSGIAVHCLNMPRGLVTLGGVWKLARLLRRLRPDVVQTWMYHADFLGGLVARAVGVRRVFWGVHATNLENGMMKRATILIARINALLSPLIPRRIVSCSQAGVLVHQAIGYAAGKFTVIPNGYDLCQFAPDSQAGHALRSTLAVPDGVPLLGMVARFDPQKDHINLIAALGLLKQNGQDFRCALVGGGMTEDNTGLISWLDIHGIRDRVLLLGQRGDIPSVMSTLDVHVLSSCGEAFPNVLAEAMACGVPCVSTDVGDAKLIVGDTGWVVPAKSPEKLAFAIADAIKQQLADPAAWGRRREGARQRILNRFSIDNMVDGYNRAWAES